MYFQSQVVICRIEWKTAIIQLLENNMTIAVIFSQESRAINIGDKFYFILLKLRICIGHFCNYGTNKLRNAHKVSSCYMQHLS